ncbi:hypothetical protein LEP1GSC034_0130 [Leptospira interrogans str. 2003000735]|uniref:Uncharacterized protein n=3 Tax=Leptospira interrogans TaxID=173 RepID=A0A829D1I9_LEPIR|nr:hypothetical protein [Leptospira interrogans]EMM83178.1 hypothetical protein LEP1GSC037_2556 [Leptospira interrogans str. 2006001854]EMY04157.1 hypothetical protein LEP1GSC029_2247 [Leptospira interrogans str. 2002000626]EMY24696.1 hypothetical protein LEP1GSC115_5292 [Leptospira interrogans serovar Australis str. 200703203]EMJ74006.1 hypothetical protein LEP1GSC033_3653 [Leptospira interrogans str. 2002000632]EMJ75423.1 hypothetical protein LEP1GSC034_0130 [Leptospira interrogans str. 2003
MKKRRSLFNKPNSIQKQILKKILRLFYFVFILSILFTNITCEQNTKNKIQKVLSNRQIPIEEKIRQTSFLLLGDRLKEIEISPNFAPDGSATGSLVITLSVGGNTALTFLGQKEYKERMKLEAALLSFRVLQTLKGLPIESLRVSIVKPYYVKNSETDSIEEFEVFRAKMEKNSLTRIQGFETVDSFAADSYDSPEPEVLDVMVQIVQTWKVELDELNRVELN